MVITPDPKADRYAHPYTVTMSHPEVTVNVVIVGPSQIPIFTTAQDFREDPELGRLVIMAHADIPGVKEAWVEGIPDGGDATSYIEDGLCLSSSKNPT
ncbi:MAG: hypothetical protein GEV11_25150 [Streptosporangiales bacterium]|nr:hypothetical protein [Streptosporangiales bacterium]